MSACRVFFVVVLVLVLLLLSGCVTTDRATRVDVVEVVKPVFTVPESLRDLPKVERPDLAYNYLVIEDKERPDDVIKSLIESILQLQNYCEKLEANEAIIRAAMFPAK